MINQTWKTAKWKALLMVAALSSTGAIAATGCSLDGTYARATTLKSPMVQVLTITGHSARVFEQALQRDGSEQIAQPVSFVGERVKISIYDVKDNATSPDRSRVFNLVDQTGKAGYLGFEFDCATRQIFHPSIGEWTRIQ